MRGPQLPLDHTTGFGWQALSPASRGTCHGLPAHSQGWPQACDPRRPVCGNRGPRSGLGLALNLRSWPPGSSVVLLSCMGLEAAWNSVTSQFTLKALPVRKTDEPAGLRSMSPALSIRVCLPGVTPGLLSPERSWSNYSFLMNFSSSIKSRWPHPRGLANALGPWVP